MEIERALQQLELLQKKLYAYHCADSSLYLDAVQVPKRKLFGWG